MLSSDIEQVSLSEARKTLGDLVAKACFGNRHVVITKNGHKAAALVPMEEYELIEEFHRVSDLKRAKAALKRAKKEGTLTTQEVEEILFGD